MLVSASTGGVSEPETAVNSAPACGPEVISATTRYGLKSSSVATRKRLSGESSDWWPLPWARFVPAREALLVQLGVVRLGDERDVPLGGIGHVEEHVAAIPVVGVHHVALADPLDDHVVREDGRQAGRRVLPDVERRLEQVERVVHEERVPRVGDVHDVEVGELLVVDEDGIGTPVEVVRPGEDAVRLVRLIVHPARRVREVARMLHEQLRVCRVADVPDVDPAAGPRLGRRRRARAGLVLVDEEHAVEVLVLQAKRVGALARVVERGGLHERARHLERVLRIRHVDDVGAGALARRVAEGGQEGVLAVRGNVSDAAVVPGPGWIGHLGLADELDALADRGQVPFGHSVLTRFGDALAREHLGAPEAVGPGARRLSAHQEREHGQAGHTVLAYQDPLLPNWWTPVIAHFGASSNPSEARNHAALVPLKACQHPCLPAHRCNASGPCGVEPGVVALQPAEAELVERARSGDGDAYVALLRLHEAAAFRTAYLILGSANDAEDATQEAFVKAFRALGRFDSERPFRPWLLRIVATRRATIDARPAGAGHSPSVPSCSAKRGPSQGHALVPGKLRARGPSSPRRSRGAP